MYIVVVSDNHGLVKPLEKIKEIYHDAAAFIHCGDSELDPRRMPGWVSVQGNNDYYYDYPEYLVLDVDGVRTFVIHGQQFSRLSIVAGVVKKARENQCVLACFGHTHVYQVEEKDGVLVVNPGSIRYNRDGSKPCFALVHYDNDCVYVERKNVEDIL